MNTHMRIYVYVHTYMVYTTKITVILYVTEQNWQFLELHTYNS
jgi:hypothetical protein